MTVLLGSRAVANQKVYASATSILSDFQKAMSIAARGSLMVL